MQELTISDSYLNGLNEIQRNAVCCIDGPVMVIAGPGSGKTRVLTYRITHLLKSGIPPWQILALTFTNKAAREMKDRIEKIAGQDAYKVWAGTFEDYQTRHFTQRISTEEIGKDTYRVITNYHILYTPEQGQTNVLVTGHYDDEIVLGDTPLFKSKKAVMDTNVSPRYIVYPV